MIRALPLLVLGVLACTSATDDPDHAPRDTGGTDAGVVADAEVFTNRVAVFLLADSARLAAARADYDDNDWATVGDDMMWYRAEAWTWLEERGIPVVSVEGRPTLSFRVAGAVRAFDFGDSPTADVVVLYEPDREPRALPPIDVAMSAHEYFGIP